MSGRKGLCAGAEGVEEKLERIKEQLAIIGPNHLLRGLCFKPGPKARLQGGMLRLALLQAASINFVPVYLSSMISIVDICTTCGLAKCVSSKAAATYWYELLIHTFKLTMECTV